MNSETSTRYGSRVRRHGKSRAARAHQANKRRVKLTFCARRILTPCPPFESSPPVPLLSPHPLSLSRHFCPHPCPSLDTFVLTPVPLSTLLSSPPVPLSLRERGDEELTVRSPSPRCGEEVRG